MTDQLLDQVTAVFLPDVHSLGFAIVHHQESESFGDALVIAQAGDVRVRITRDRDQIIVYVGSTIEPETWFDIDDLARLLGLPTGSVPIGTDVSAVSRATAAFLLAAWNQLTEVLSRPQFPETKRAVTALARARFSNMFGKSK